MNVYKYTSTGDEFKLNIKRNELDRMKDSEDTITYLTKKVRSLNGKLSQVKGQLTTVVKHHDQLLTDNCRLENANARLTEATDNYSGHLTRLKMVNDAFTSIGTYKELKDLADRELKINRNPLLKFLFRVFSIR